MWLTRNGHPTKVIMGPFNTCVVRQLLSKRQCVSRALYDRPIQNTFPSQVRTILPFLHLMSIYSNWTWYKGNDFKCHATKYLLLSCYKWEIPNVVHPIFHAQTCSPLKGKRTVFSNSTTLITEDMLGNNYLVTPWFADPNKKRRCAIACVSCVL